MTLVENLNTNSEAFDSDSRTGIMTAEEVAQLFAKSESWVYKHWRELGGVKLGGSLFFPNKEDLYERLFQKGKGLEVRFHPQGREVHSGLVSNQNRGSSGDETSTVRIYPSSG